VGDFVSHSVLDAARRETLVDEDEPLAAGRTTKSEIARTIGV
jgi:hypothetical protein